MSILFFLSKVFLRTPGFLQALYSLNAQHDCHKFKIFLSCPEKMTQYFLVDSLHSGIYMQSYRNTQKKQILQSSLLHKLIFKVFKVCSDCLCLASTLKGASNFWMAHPITTTVGISLILRIKKVEGVCQNIGKERILKGFD